MFEPTIYGKKKIGESRFVIVAPHGAGDDLKTGYLARRLAKKLQAGVVMNKKFIKIDNSRAQKFPELVEDFNELRWSIKNNKYLWAKKNPAMKIFYRDIKKMCAEINARLDKQAVVVYIHGLKSENKGLDLGVGLRPKGSRLFGKMFHGEIGGNTGEITVKIGDAKKLKRFLGDRLKKDFDLDITVGEEHSSWSKQSATQFHKHEGRSDYALQIEVSRRFRRDKEGMKYIVNLLADGLKEVFGSEMTKSE